LSGRRRILRNGKRGLFTDHIAGDDDSVFVAFRAKIVLVVEGVAKKYTQGGTRSEFVSGSGKKVGVALVAKNA
jgi:hypothetical protein